MGFFSSLFEKPRRAEQLEASFDLERGIVCDLGREDSRETIAKRLGRPTSAIKEAIFFDQIGLHFCVTKTGRVTEWGILFDPVDPQAKSRWRCNGGTASSLTLASLVALFGEATSTETDEIDVDAGGEPVTYVSRTWKRPHLHLMIDFSNDELESINVDFDV